MIQPFDHVIFRIARTGEIHALATVKRTYFDDQTPIWDRELELTRVLYPWRVDLALMLYCEESILKTYIKISDYVDGYGIGELPQHDLNSLLTTIATKTDVKVRLT